MAVFAPILQAIRRRNGGLEYHRNKRETLRGPFKGPFTMESQLSLPKKRPKSLMAIAIARGNLHSFTW
jgi:hypothetical protein